MNIAILGASGIGKNHARWFMGHGCHFTAFLGSTQDSVAKTAATLGPLLGFTGRGYADLGELLGESRPDAVCISSPNDQHYGHALQCIEAGVPVLCEKPLTHDEALSDDANLERAREMVTLASRANVLLGTQMQYVFMAEPLLAMTGVAPEEIEEFSMVMETKNLIAGRDGRRLWIDLAPHPLSLLQKLVPGATLGTCQSFEDNGLISIAKFTMSRPNGQSVRATVQIGCVPGQDPVRRVTLNGKSVDYSGFKDTDGIFKGRMETLGQAPITLPDFVNSLIGNFVAACQGKAQLQVDGAAGERNLELLLQLCA